MLPAVKNKLTVSILDKLKAKGPTAPKGPGSALAPAPITSGGVGLMGAHDDSDIDNTDGGPGTSIQAPTVNPNLTAALAKKKKPTDEEDEEATV